MHLVVRVACGRLTTVAIHVVNCQRVVGLREVRHQRVVSGYIINGVACAGRYDCVAFLPVHEVVASGGRGRDRHIVAGVVGACAAEGATCGRVGRQADGVLLQRGELNRCHGALAVAVDGLHLEGVGCVGREVREGCRVGVDRRPVGAVVDAVLPAGGAVACPRYRGRGAGVAADGNGRRRVHRVGHRHRAVAGRHVAAHRGLVGREAREDRRGL